MRFSSKSVMVWGLMLLVLFPWYSYAEDPKQAPFSQQQIDQMVAPIALYPDPLLSQVLMASTYPLEVVSAARWLKENSNLKGQALQDALQSQNWDPSVKSLTEVPDVLNMLNDKLDMTTNLGNAFLDQQNQVLDSIQSLRAKAEAAGYLKSGKEQVVKTEAPAQSADQSSGSGATYITINSTDPDTVYVPIYDPDIVYGAWPYPDYPPYFYYPSGYVLGSGIGLIFATSLFVGNAFWGYCNWHDHYLGIYPNRFNAFNRTNINNTRWAHDPAHRAGVPYRSAATQGRFGQSQLQAVHAREAFRGHSQQLLGGRQNLSHAQRNLAHGQNQNVAAARGRTNRANVGGHRSNAFEGIRHGGAQTRQFSHRGTSSLSGSGFHGAQGFHGGSGFHGGGHGGGGFHGGGHGGGGFHGGGHGGGGHGGRR